MIKNFCFIVIVLFSFCARAQKTQPLVIETKNTSLVYSIGNDQRLHQTYLGKKLMDKSGYEKMRAGGEAYLTSGMENQFEPAIRMVHNDGNPSLELRYVSHKTSTTDNNITSTQITLKDSVYPVEVVLHITSYFNEDVIRTWTEITHHEKKPVLLTKFASTMLHFDAEKYWLTQFHGDWAREARMEENELSNGIKILDSKLGVRANLYQSPMFLVSMNEKSSENKGDLLAGTLEWTGNFQFLFEIDNRNSLRIIPGINPSASEYYLEPNKTFVTPAFLYTFSAEGKGLASRNLHRWARNYGVLDGTKDRLTLLNNWEATYFNFNENKLVELFDGAKKLGVDLFLLDDGWFGNKYPRDNDKTSLGDWQEDKKKLPSGIGYLVKEAQDKGIKFGIWLEPEMVNPKSELYEKHPDWILKLPNRAENYSRNQLVLDLTNPKVQDFVFSVIDDMMTKNPGVAFIKWDCNRPMSNAYSPYLKDKQSHLFIEYVRSFYKVLDRVRAKYPHLPIMLCSGGGGRTDYGALKYFTEFWPSDNTDPLDRVYIQWGYSQFFPSNTISAHITDMGKQSLKFRTDVAMSGKLGYDIRVNELTEKELLFSSEAVKTYKRLSSIIWFGDLYRLVSPYENNRAVIMYVSEKKDRAVAFNYNLATRRQDVFNRVKLEGLDPKINYRVREVNLFPGTNSSLPENDKLFSGDFLMTIGINLSGGRTAPMTSNIIELIAE